MNYDYNPNDLVGNDINNMIEEKLTNTNYSENFENIEGNDMYEEYDNQLDDNFNIEVLNSDLSNNLNLNDESSITNTINYDETNNLTTFINEEEKFNKYNIIPNNGLSSKLINKPYNVVLYENITGNYTFNLNEIIKNVVSVKLLSARASSLKTDSWGGKFFAIIKIDELNKNISAYDPSDPVDNNNGINVIEDSFAVLENYNNYLSNATSDRNWYRNEFIYNHDITYFDPPRPQLDKLTISIYDTPFTTSTANDPLQLRMNLLIETTEKIRIY